MINSGCNCLLLGGKRLYSFGEAFYEGGRTTIRTRLDACYEICNLNRSLMCCNKPGRCMTNYSSITLVDARREYLATSTTAMPIGGLIAWTALALASYVLGDNLPSFAPFVAAASPVPIALVIDKLRGKLGIWTEGRQNPVSQLFMRFITVGVLLIPFAVISAQAANDLAILILGLAIFAGILWVPHGWGADDPAGFIHFVLRALLCYAAYLLAPESVRGAAIAGAAALTYVYAIAAMRKPSSVR